MKKFSTVILGMLGLVCALQAAAQDTRSLIADNAPDRHVVVKGDTLWGISGEFLKQPWRWPEVWNLNRDQIKNPHWIYPGQVIVLDRATGRLRLGESAGAGGSLQTVKLSPQVRVEPIERQAIPSIPSGVIEPYLSQPLIISANGFDNAPRIAAAQEGRVFLGSGDLAYVRGALDEKVKTYHIYRPGQPLFDPDGDGKTPLGYEAYYLGTAELTRKGDPATFTITYAKEEMGIGDRLAVSPSIGVINYVPHPPETNINARVMSIYGGVSTGQAGQNQVVTLNRGKADGVETGHVLAVWRAGKTVADRTSGKGGMFSGGYEDIKLPDERYGLVFVFRVFDKVSYALVMNTTLPVVVGDRLTKP